MKNTTAEKNYPFLFFHANAQWKIGLLVTLLTIGISGGFYLWYIHSSNDVAPDSIAGFGYAILGTTFLLLAGILYSIRRRSRNNRTLGQLNTALNLHVFFALIGLALLFMHSFGNFNPRTGTYALYGLIALVISGFIGRALDHLMPRLIAGQVHIALTSHGEDRIETISHKLQAIVAHNTQTLYSRPVHENVIPSLLSGQALSGSEGSLTQEPFSHAVGAVPGACPSEASHFEQRPLHTPWDLAYISLEATPQELSRILGKPRLVPDQHSALTRPGALMPGAQQHISELQHVQRAMQREQFYRYIIRYWRLFHIALALLTLGLTIWHLVYAAQLLLH